MVIALKAVAKKQQLDGRFRLCRMGARPNGCPDNRAILAAAERQLEIRHDHRTPRPKTNALSIDGCDTRDSAPLLLLFESRVLEKSADLKQSSLKGHHAMFRELESGLYQLINDGNLNCSIIDTSAYPETSHFCGVLQDWSKQSQGVSRAYAAIAAPLA
jgi:hypothetical protein